MTRTPFAMKPEERMAAWRRLLELSRQVGAAEAAIPTLEAAAYRGIVLTTAKQPFPQDTPLGQDLARVFLAVAKRYVEEGNPEIRAVLKPALAGGAHTLELLLDYAASAAAEPATKRRFPGDWD